MKGRFRKVAVLASAMLIGGLLNGIHLAGAQTLPTVTVTATDANGCTGTHPYTVVINPPPNTVPKFTSTVNATREEGAMATGSLIATVSDVEQAPDTLTLLERHW